MATETQNEVVRDSTLEDYIKAITAKDPYRYPGYEKSVHHAEELAPHVFGDRPDVILKKYRPNRPSSIEEYVLEAFEPLTFTEFGKVTGIVNTIWAPGTFSIQHKDDTPASLPDKETPKQYFERDFGQYGSVTNYIKDVDVTHTFGVPGGVTTIEWQVIPNEYPRPLPCSWEARQVLDYDPDGRNPKITILLDEKSRIKVAGQDKWEGKIIQIYTKTEVIRLEQTGEKTDEKYTTERKVHNLGYIPAYRQGGNMEVRGGIPYPRSFVAPIIAPWNKAIQILADLDGARVQSLFPKMIRAKMDCTTCKATGRLKDPVLGKDSTIKCTSCGGSGDLMYGNNDPFGEIAINIQRFPDIDINKMWSYITPPVDVLTKQGEEFENEIRRGFEALNLRRVNSENPQESGIAKAIDRTEHENWLRELWRHFAGHMLFIYTACTDIRYGPTIANASDIVPTISPPVRFDYQSVQDAYTEYKSAKDAGVPSAVLRPLLKQVITKQFGQHSPIAKRAITEVEIDPFPGMTEDELLTLNALRPIQPLQAKLKTDLSRLVVLAIEQDSDFLEGTLQERREVIEELAKAELEAEEAAKPPVIVPPIEEPPE